MAMFQLCNDDIVEELRLIQTLNRASKDGKTVIHFQNLFDFSDMTIPLGSKESRVGENNLKQ